MKYVGVDLHKKVIQICVVDQARKVLDSRRFYNDQGEKLQAYFKALGDFEFVVEATAAYEWFVQLLEPLAKRFLLCHPGKMRVIAESVNKNDKVDARVLGQFLALDMIPQAYRPTARQREHRVLVRHRARCQRQVSGLRCRIRFVLANYNADRKDLFRDEGWSYLRTVKVSAADRFVLEQLLADLEHAQKQLREASQQLQAFAKRGPAKEQEARALARSVPGIGVLVSEAALAELADVSRFRALKKVCAYVGFVPKNRDSADKTQRGNITKQGSPLLRWALVQAAWQAVRCSIRWQRVFENLSHRCGRKRAIVAVARRLLCVLVAVLKSGRPYHYAHDERPNRKQVLPRPAKQTGAGA